MASFTGHSSELFISGQTSLPIEMCGHEQPVERICALIGRLDFLTAGVNVNIGSGVTYDYLAIEITLFSDYPYSDIYSESPPIGDYHLFPPLPQDITFHEYTPSCAYRYWSPYAETFVGDTIRRSYINYNGVWCEMGDLPIVGMPEELTYPFWFNRVTLAPGQDVGNSDPSTDELSRSTVHRYVDPEGPEISDATVPFEDPVVLFREGPAKIEMRHRSANYAEKFPFGGPTGNGWAYKVHGQFITTTVDEWPPADIHVDYNGKHYTLGGARAALDHNFFSSPYQVHIPDGQWEGLDEGTLLVLLRTPRGSGTGGGTGTVPPGAITYMDFDNGFYYSGGSLTQPITDLLGDAPDTEAAGGQFNPGAIVPGRGMLLSFNGSSDIETEECWTNRPYAIGTFYDELANVAMNGGRVVIEVTCQFSPYGMLIGFFDAPSENDTFDWISFEMNWELSDGYDVGIDPEIGDAPDLYRIELGINIDIGGGNRRYSIKVNDGPVLTQDIDYADPFPTTTLSYITIGHDGDDGPLDTSYIRTIAIYPP